MLTLMEHDGQKPGEDEELEILDLSTENSSEDACGPRCCRRPVIRIGALSAGAGSMGALAVGAFSIGALAIGALAIRRLKVQETTMHSVHIKDLRVDRLDVGEYVSSE